MPAWRLKSDECMKVVWAMTQQINKKNTDLNFKVDLEVETSTSLLLRKQTLKMVNNLSFHWLFVCIISHQQMEKNLSETNKPQNLGQSD